MAKSTDIRIKEVTISQENYDYRTPIKFGGRVVNDVAVINIYVDVEAGNGRTGRGRGSMPMGNVWAWPTDVVEGADTLRAMIRFAELAASRAADFDQAGHPLEITHEFAKQYGPIAAAVSAELNLAESMPKLAELVSASPLEAALHAAYGVCHEANSYNLLGSDFANQDISAYLNEEFSGEFLDRYTSRTPKPTMPLYHLVGALDPLAESDVTEPVGDALPESLGDWIAADGLTHLKIKLNGDDLAWDVERVVTVERVAEQAQSKRGVRSWHYSLDFNEKCANVQYLIDFMHQVQERSPAAMQRVQYIEQPTHRDLRANPENRMHEAAKIKPVVIDESLVDFESLLLAREQGYSGVALKACKGHTEALLMGAAAQKYGLFLCVQDLTCIGASLLHSASLAARIPTIAAIESNGRQYCPAGNAAWVDRFPGMFNITDGTVATSELDGTGLGF